MNSQHASPSSTASIRRASRWFGWMVLVAWTGGVAVRAEFLQPVAAIVSNGEGTEETLFNGQGFEDPGLGTPESVHLAVGSEMWSGIGSIRAQVVLDLGKPVDLTKVYLWNYNVAGNTDWGMKDVQIWVSPDADPATAKFTGIATFGLTEGGDRAQSFDVVGTDVRLVKIRNTSNWGNGFAIGLAEVRFESGDIPGNVPVVAITGLKDGDVIPFGSDFTLSATVTDKDNDLAKVEFFDGTTKLDEKTRAPFSTTLKNLAQGEHTLRVVATDAAGKTAWSQVEAAVREVVPGKIVQVDDNRDIGTDLHQIQYTGTWNYAPGNVNDPRFLHDDHYSDARNAYFEVRFVGVKIDVYATVASHHGSGTATIDGGTAYTVSYKAAQRAEQKLVWSSPLLPNREHVLRVTVVGNGVVTADRFDITQSDTPSDDRATLKKWDAAVNRFSVEMEDVGASRLDTATVSLTVDGAVVPVTVTKAGAVTTTVYTPGTPFAPGSQHPFKLAAKDTLGNAVGAEAVFTVPAPPWPLGGLGEPAGEAGQWSLRQIWNAGRADALVTSVDIALAAGKPGFAGKVSDARVSVINHALSTSPGGGGLMPEDEPFPAETEGLAASDSVVVARARVRIPQSGDWTIGVHSDDGFGLRFIGHPFASVSGLGVIDEQYPEYVSYQVGTADSNTRAVLKGVAAGDYGVELVYFNRTGGSFVEVYAAPGEIAEDADSSEWALIGAPGGLQLVADELPAAPPALGAIRYASGSVTIDFTSTKPASSHRLHESADLKTWQVVPSATFAATGANAVRATVSNPTGGAKFYRVSVNP